MRSAALLRRCENESKMEMFLADDPSSVVSRIPASLLSIHGRLFSCLDGVDAVDAYMVEERLFWSFVHQTHHLYRFWVAVLLCAYYSKLGYGALAAAAFPHLFIIQCLLDTGVTPDTSVEMSDGLRLDMYTMDAHWDDVLGAFFSIREAYPWKPLSQRMFASSGVEQPLDPGGSERLEPGADALDPWDYHGTLSNEGIYGGKCSRRCSLGKKFRTDFRNRYRVYWKAW